LTKIYYEACYDVLITYDDKRNTEAKSWLFSLSINRNRLKRLKGLISMVYFLVCVVSWARQHAVHQRKKRNINQHFDVKRKLLCNLIVRV